MSRSRVLLRLAWRDAVRHKGRSLLIMAMVGLPVLAIGGGDVLFRSANATPEHVVAENLADASAFLYAPQDAGWASQSTDVRGAAYPGMFARVRPAEAPPPSDGVVALPPGLQGSGNQLDPYAAPIRAPEQVLPLLPEGSTITRWDHGTVPISADGSIYRSATADLLDLTSPAAGDRYRLVGGRLPESLREVALTPVLAEALGVGIGDTVSAGAPADEVLVVGLVQETVSGARPVSAVVGLPGSVAGVQLWAAPRYLVASPVLITPDLVRELNAHGIQAYSRAAVLASPQPNGDPVGDPAMIGFVAGILLVGLGLMQVVFLSGPAFAIAARRMRRQLGLAAATGATPRQVAAVVLAGGLLLGVLAALVGTGLGVLLGVAAMPLLTRWFGAEFPNVVIRPGELLLIAGIGAMTALLAASWPAVGMLRMSPMAALARRTRPPRRPGLISLGGLVLAGIGVAAVVLAASGSVPDGMDTARFLNQRMPFLLGGMAAIQVGLIVGTPQLVAGFGVLQRVLPTGSRLALRAAGRHRGRSTGAVATVLVATAAGVLVASLSATVDAEMTRDYRPSLRDGQLIATELPAEVFPGTTRLAGADPVDVAARIWPGVQVAAFSKVLPEDMDRQGEPEPVIPPEKTCPWYQPGAGPQRFDPTEQRAAPGAAELPAARVDPRCFGMGFSTLTPQQAHGTSGSGFVPQLMIGTAELRRLLTGVPDPAADAALAAGDVVVLDQRYLDADRRFAVARVWVDDDGVPHTGEKRFAPAVLGKWAPSSVAAIIPPATAAELGLRAGRQGFVTEPMPPTDVTGYGAGSSTLSATAQAMGVPVRAYQENGLPWRDMPAAWLVLLGVAVLIIAVVLVTTALSVVDADDDSAIYAAVGATPRLRRMLSGWSALLTTGIGCAFGAVAGLVTAWGLRRLVTTIRQSGDTVGLVVPWGQLALLLVAVPTVAFALAAVFTRSRTPLIRRAE